MLVSESGAFGSGHAIHSARERISRPGAAILITLGRTPNVAHTLLGRAEDSAPAHLSTVVTQRRGSGAIRSRTPVLGRLRACEAGER
jgi:bifunctional N-acetylglucosamine-1-phosphate-uridyltransferase/glucosamine-1-phosphate-acetyltransferase GlmU-like protein